MQAFNLDIHPDAKARFDEQALELLVRLTTRETRHAPQTDFPEIPIRAVIPAEDILDFVESVTVPGGRTIARFFLHRGKKIGFVEDAYKDFTRLCSRILQSKPLQRYLSEAFVERAAFRWVRMRYDGSTTDSLVEFILATASEAVREVEVWIPLAYTYLSREVDFGSVILKTFTAELFNKQREAVQAKGGVNEAALLDYIEVNQQKLQGLAAVTMVVTAEPTRAYEATLEQADKVASILRYYSRAAMVPNLASCCAPFGEAEPRSILYFVSIDGLLLSKVEGTAGGDDGSLHVSDNTLQLWRETGIGAFIALSFSDDRTHFQSDLLRSFGIYTRGLLGRPLGDKLMYTFSSLEMLLLRDQAEPIQQNVGDRMAYTISSDKAERIEIVRNYKAVYKLRSQFVHHGRDVDELDELQAFLMNVWKFFLNVVHRYSEAKTREEFLQQLDDLKYS
jgi:hypothetical protein